MAAETNDAQQNNILRSIDESLKSIAASLIKIVVLLTPVASDVQITVNPK